MTTMIILYMFGLVLFCLICLAACVMINNRNIEKLNKRCDDNGIYSD